jgi:1,4-alpha-glucan branching enzyme
VISFLRRDERGGFLLFCCNFTPVVRANYEIGTAVEGVYEEAINSDAAEFGGSGVRNEWVAARPAPRHGRPYSIRVTLPPLAVVAWRKRS